MNNWFPFPERIKVSLWSLLNQYTEVKAVIWFFKSLLIGCAIAAVLYYFLER